MKYNNSETDFRVFISYSHKDLELVKVVVDVLKDIAIPMWDENFMFGHGFHEQIKMFIAHSHVFIPIITEESSKRGWVHQEIGYAMAMNAPVLPIAVDMKPGEMIHGLLAIRLEKDGSRWEEQLKKQLTRVSLNQLISKFTNPNQARFLCAKETEDRARMITEYATIVEQLGYYGFVRQKGALTSLHIPNYLASHPIWKERYGNIHMSSFRCDLQRNERIALEKHARKSGCRLIINPYLDYRAYGTKARIVRLKCLKEFLESMTNDMVQVAISEGMDVGENLLIVGDWFLAEAVTGVIGKGYKQTIFTRHAPSMQNMIKLFDQAFEECLKNERWSWDSETSREYAIEELDRIINELNNGLEK